MNPDSWAATTAWLRSRTPSFPGTFPTCVFSVRTPSSRCPRVEQLARHQAQHRRLTVVSPAPRSSSLRVFVTVPQMIIVRHL